MSAGSGPPVHTKNKEPRSLSVLLLQTYEVKSEVLQVYEVMEKECSRSVIEDRQIAATIIFIVGLQFLFNLFTVLNVMSIC